MPVSRRPAAPLSPTPGSLFTPLWLAVMLTTAPVLTAAQTAVPHATAPVLLAADPATPVPSVAPLAAPPTAASGAIELPTDIERARAIWQRANERVAEFPRGHMDILRWEAQNPDASAPASGQPVAAGPVLDMAQALRLSLRHRPALFVHAGMNELERGEVQRAYVAHVRALQRAWIDALTARQSLRLMTESLDVAATGVELGRRMVQAGNWSQAKLLREQLVEADARQTWARAQQTQMDALEQLARLLGQWNAQAVSQLLPRLPAQLPELPAQVSPGAGLSPADVEAAVLRSHPSLAWQRIEAQRRLTALGSERLAAWSRAVDGALQAASAQEASPPWSAPRINDLSLLRDHALERAVQAEADLLALATQRRSMARAAWARLQAQHASARHAQDVVTQLQASVAQETQLRYNGMLKNSWDLLAQARERIGSLDATLQAQRDFWLAQTDWQALLAGGDYESPGASDTNPGGANAAAKGH